MARRYRYSFAQKKESLDGKVSACCALFSLLLMGGAVLLSFLVRWGFGFIPGAMCLLGALLAVYGFITGLISLSDEQGGHRLSMAGSIGNGLLMIAWLGLFLTGLG